MNCNMQFHYKAMFDSLTTRCEALLLHFTEVALFELCTVANKHDMLSVHTP